MKKVMRKKSAKFETRKSAVPSSRSHGSHKRKRGENRKEEKGDYRFKAAKYFTTNFL